EPLGRFGRERPVFGTCAGYFDNLQMETLTGVESEGGNRVHKPFALYQNYPNPFNPSTTIFFELERPERAALTVFNTLGQQVAVVLDKQLEAGRHSVEFSGRMNGGEALPTGVYIYRLQTSAGFEVRKMLLLK
ncbi:MAG: T9SS type A sorting domain-containing protein, partial [Bacteroidota bacterium]